MKKIYLCALLISAAITATAQKNTIPFMTTPCADNLLESYKRLSARTGTHSCVSKVISITGYMQAGCYSLQKDSGHVTFASFFDETSGSSLFRTTWDSEPLGYNYYGVCYPSVIAWDVPHDGSTLNHVFEAYLVSTSNYQQSLSKTYAAVKKYAIRSTDIDAILSWTFETNSGWIANKENASYNNLNSSKGIIVTIRTKKKQVIDCYLLNNYDGAGTITWKRKLATANATAQEQSVQPVAQVKLTSATLAQNQPNPAANNTAIAYELPEKYTSASIRITNSTGVTIKEVKLTGHGSGLLQTDVNSLNPGTYKYSLLVDGIMIDTKTMSVIK